MSLALGHDKFIFRPRAYVPLRCTLARGFHALGQSSFSNDALGPAHECHSLENETFHHFVFECPSLYFSRQNIFLDNLPDTNLSWSVSKLLAFSYLPHINVLLDPNAVHDIILTDSESEIELEDDNEETVDDPQPMDM